LWGEKTLAFAGSGRKKGEPQDRSLRKEKGLEKLWRNLPGNGLSHDSAGSDGKGDNVWVHGMTIMTEFPSPKGDFVYPWEGKSSRGKGVFGTGSCWAVSRKDY